jgi:5'-nucleotidase
LSRIKTIHILHTNDIHSHFELMPKAATVIRDQTNQWGIGSTLVVDIGDHMDRMRLETEGTEGKANIDILNATGYDAVCLGNNEGLTFTREALGLMYQGANFSVTTANLNDRQTATLPEWIKPYHIIEKKGLKVALIGVTVAYENFYTLLGWNVIDPVEVLEHWVNTLRTEVDLIVVLSHLGLNTDQKLATRVPGIDVILGGHTHHLLEQPIQIGTTWIAGAGKFGQYVGHIQMDWDVDRKQLDSVTGEVLATEGIRSAEDIQQIIDSAKIEAELRLSEPVATLSAPAPIDWIDESHLGNLLSRALRQWVGAEVGIVNAGQLLNGLDQGVITRKKLLEICPSPINPCRLVLRGEQIAYTLEQSLLADYQNKPIRGFGFRGKVLGSLCLSGIKVVYTSSYPDFKKINTIEINGSPLESNRQYSIGTIDMFTFGVGYELFKQAEDIQYFLPEMIREVLGRALSDSNLLLRSQEIHWLKAEEQI